MTIKGPISSAFMFVVVVGMGVLAAITLAQDNTTPAPSLSTSYAFTIEAGISVALTMGATVDGTRRSIPITGGTVNGADIKGTIVPGGADYQVTGSDGNTRISAIYMIKTDDDVLINVVNDGVIVPPAAGTNASLYFRTSPRFTAPNGKYGWLNNTIFVSAVRLDPAKPGVVMIDVYKLL